MIQSAKKLKSTKLKRRQRMPTPRASLTMTVQVTNGEGEEAFQTTQAATLPENTAPEEVLTTLQGLAQAATEEYAATQQ